MLYLVRSVPAEWQMSIKADQMLNRYVAIKVLKKQYKEDENFVRKFRSRHRQQPD